MNMVSLDREHGQYFTPSLNANKTNFPITNVLRRFHYCCNDHSVALTPEQTQKRIKSILAPEINELLIYMETGDREPLSNFMEQLLNGALCHLDGEDPEDDTFEQVERMLSEYYVITDGFKTQFLLYPILLEIPNQKIPLSQTYLNF